MGDRNRRELEAVLLRQHFERRDRLLAVRAVVIDEADLLALQLVGAAELLGDVLDGDVGCGPVGAEQREVIGEHRAVLGIRTAVAHRDDRDLVGRRLLGEREGDAGRQRVEERSAGRALALQPLVAFHALVGGVAGLAFLDQQLDAVDAAVTLVDHVLVVDHAVCERHAVHAHRRLSGRTAIGTNCSFCAEAGVDRATPATTAAANKSLLVSIVTSSSCGPA